MKLFSIVDYFYSPITWIIINMAILIGIFLVVRTTNKVKKLQVDLTRNKLYQELIDALNKNVEMNQKEIASYYANTIIKYVVSIRFSQINQSQTFREFIESLKIHKFIHEEDLNTLINLYERLRFSNEIIDDEDIEKLRSTILKIGESVKSYIETQFHED